MNQPPKLTTDMIAAIHLAFDCEEVKFKLKSFRPSVPAGLILGGAAHAAALAELGERFKIDPASLMPWEIKLTSGQKATVAEALEIATEGVVRDHIYGLGNVVSAATEKFIAETVRNIDAAKAVFPSAGSGEIEFAVSIDEMA